MTVRQVTSRFMTKKAHVARAAVSTVLNNNQEIPIIPSIRQLVSHSPEEAQFISICITYNLTK
jgi:hypothetical protein